ncbi:hypothetical protein KAR91_37740 [Candidatus Pacearchaeota archaeon]|nr:hypothetical protein [Candidatus Pacearchaeota archaeon]
MTGDDLEIIIPILTGRLDHLDQYRRQWFMIAGAYYSGLGNGINTIFGADGLQVGACGADEYAV